MDYTKIVLIAYEEAEEDREIGDNEVLWSWCEHEVDEPVGSLHLRLDLEAWYIEEAFEETGEYGEPDEANESGDDEESEVPLYTLGAVVGTYRGDDEFDEERTDFFECTPEEIAAFFVDPVHQVEVLAAVNDLFAKMKGTSEMMAA